MFAVHWICALTLALVSCLCAQPVKRADNGILQHIEDLNKTIIKQGCPHDIRLYSPVIGENCLSSDVNCTISELLVLESECEKLEEAMENLVNAMQETKWNIPDISTSERKCERNGESDVKTFLDNVKQLVECLNSKERQQR